MNDFKSSNEILDKEMHEFSMGPGYYTTNTIQTETKPVYPWAPTARIQKIGGSLIKDINTIDIDSELLGLNRKNSKDMNMHYKPSEEEIIKFINLEDGFFHQESSLITNPRSELRGNIKNRWIVPFKDPILNTIEPFDRLGENTYLQTMDEDEECN